jgi:hypothetical protein
MWPPSVKAGIKKMQLYKKKKRSIDKVKKDNIFELLKLPFTHLSEIWNTAIII